MENFQRIPAGKDCEPAMTSFNNRSVRALALRLH
jgi:hypothetical protein